MSMQEIARRTGVSYATISRAFNQPEKVRPRTLLRIRELCDELNYRPRVIPNNLSTVSVIVPDHDHVAPIDGILLSYVVTELSRHGMPTVVATMQSLKSHPNVFQKAFIGILHEIDDEDMKLLRHYSKIGPFIAINDMADNIGPHATRIGSDHPDAVNQAMDRLIAAGHRRIAFVLRRLPVKGCNDRLDAYRKRMNALGGFDESLVFFNEEQYLFEGLRRIRDARPTAMLVGEAHLTLKVLHYGKLMDLHVPDNLSMITFEHAGGTQHLFPPITSVVQPIDDLGHAAARLILDHLAHPEQRKIKSQYLPYRLIDRESVRPL
ncbi:MAG: LacI family DNA-binding transcriptional regulator [Phycisphaeraceae bacterium]|nr:LacI family DNA-binding transcriptional regulator [Phycisphaeraceae bacterium]